jgi:hypothetical protein
MLIHPEIQMQLIAQDRERAMKRAALERQARSITFDGTGAGRQRRRNPLLRLAAVAGTVAGFSGRAIHIRLNGI